MDTDIHTELGGLWLSVLCSVLGESGLLHNTEVAALEAIPWQMVKSGFCSRDFGQTNEQQRYLNEMLVDLWLRLGEPG